MVAEGRHKMKKKKLPNSWNDSLLMLYLVVKLIHCAVVVVFFCFFFCFFCDNRVTGFLLVTSLMTFIHQDL